MSELNLSIIIPCYNSGNYLLDALESLECIEKNISYEVIIIDDGSTENHTLNLFDSFKGRYIVIHQINKGPAAARNAGVKISKGEYILFLDSDNKIKKEYISKSVKIFKDNSRVGVVYAKPSFFGDLIEPRFTTGPFDFVSLLHGNYIDMCAIVRKKAWEEVAGLDEEKILIGFEDWEFWIRISLAEWQFYYIDEVLFEYRISKNSLVTTALEEGKYKKMQQYVYIKHIDIFIKHFRSLAVQYRFYLDDQANPFRSFVKFTVNKFRL